MSKHLKRLNSPRALKIHRKERTWTVHPSAGPHKLKESVSLGLIIRDYLKYADTLKEVKNILTDGQVKVNGVERKDYQFPCGFMDVISIPKLKKDFRVLLDRKGKITLVPIKSSDAKWKLCKIEDKKRLKENKIQLNLHDGKNFIVKKDDYQTGDVLKIVFKENKIDDIYKFEKGTVAMITNGSHIGEIADIKDIRIIKTSKPNLTIMKGKNEFTTLKEYVFPIGKKKPVIELPEVKVQ